MNDAIHSKLQKKLADYRSWSLDRKISGCRLVHYCGRDLLGVLDVSLTEIEEQIEGLVCDGYYVDWAERDSCLYLRVWEFGGPEPEWPTVFAERPLKINGAIHAKGDGFTHAAWGQLVSNRPEFRRPSPQQIRNPVTNELIVIPAPADAAEVWLNGSLVGVANWSMSGESLVNVSIEPSALHLVLEWATALGGEFRPESPNEES